MASLTKKVVNGRPYYYLRETARVGGRSKVVRQVYLGRAEDIERRLAETTEPKSVMSRSFGAVAAALRLCRELEVAEAVDRAVGVGGGRRQGLSVGEMIMLAAINRACKPRSKRQLSDWHSRSALVRLLPAAQQALSSQRFWDAMDVVSEQAIAQAETEIVRRCIGLYRIELRPLIYDATNFATFIDSANERNTIAQRGHPKGGRRDLRLIGLALCVALDCNIPLCHQTYEGNRNDSTHFPEAIELIKTRLGELGLTEDQLSELTLVYDKGNNSKTNQPLADELPLGVVGSLSPSQHPELLDAAHDQFHELAQMPGTLAYRAQMEVYEQQRTIVVSRSQSFAAKQRRSFQQTLAKATANSTSSRESSSAASTAWTSARSNSESRTFSAAAGSNT
jgi:transposase